MSWQEFLFALTWRDALDLGLLIALSYGLLRLLRGTRVVPVLLSVAFFAALGFVARALDLVAMATLLRYFLEYVIIILIVVFHQELRRFLLRMGQRLLPGGRRQAAGSAVSELLTAVERLQRAGLGALFVLEGELDVAQMCSDQGREVDAPVRADTLTALAVPHPANRLHDGAVLIEDLRITRAGLICPLSQRDDLEPIFGTRHRGALGLSEETDALVIVLSEERREIRVCERGTISDPLDRRSLEEAILNWLDRPAPVGARESGVSAAQLAASRSGSVPREGGGEPTAAKSGLRVVSDEREARP